MQSIYLRPVCGNPLWQKHLARHSGYCVPIRIRRNIQSCSYRIRELSFCKWWFNERKKEKKNLQKFWCRYRALSWETKNLKHWTDAAEMYRSKTDSRELASDKSQRFIVYDPVQHSLKVYSDVCWLKCTASNWQESDRKDMVSSGDQSVTNIDISCQRNVEKSTKIGRGM